MSNQVNLRSTAFIDNNQVTDYGYRLADDYDKIYGDIWEKAPESDFDLLARVVYDAKAGDEALSTFLASITSSKKGININDTFYDWSQIKHIF